MEVGFEPKPANFRALLTNSVLLSISSQSRGKFQLVIGACICFQYCLDLAFLSQVPKSLDALRRKTVIQKPPLGETLKFPH